MVSPHRVVRPDPPRPVWLGFQPGAWVATVVYTWQLRDDGWWAEIDYAANGSAPQRVFVRAEQLRPRDPIHVGRTHRCVNPP